MNIAMHKIARVKTATVKKHLLAAFLFFYLITFSSAIAQTEWAPVGAKWTYQIYDMWNYIFKLETYSSVKDTQVQNKTCRKIEINTLVIDSSNHTKTNFKKWMLMYGDQGKVFYNYKDTFLLLYDFSLKAGDTLIIPKIYYNEFKDSLKTRYKIVSIENINISGVTLQKQLVHLIPDSPIVIECNRYFCGTYQSCFIIEGLGAMNYMFGEQYVLEELFSSLKCYEDNNIIYKKYPTADCENFDAVKDIEQRISVNLYPVPAGNELILSYSGQKPFDMQIVNSLGVVMKVQNNVKTDLITIDVKSFESAVYFIILKTNNSELVKKFIKN